MLLFFVAGVLALQGEPGRVFEVSFVGTHGAGVVG